MRIGYGYDVHKLVSDRKLIVGGVEIPHDKGLLGHSDADVLVHAIMDAMLGAAGLGDIGKHFPDNNIKYKDISSLELLKTVKEMLLEEGYVLGNLDATIIAEAPKMSIYFSKMKKNICEVLETDEKYVNLKATTEEGLGFTGNREGIAASCVCLIESLYEASSPIPERRCDECPGCKNI